MKTDYIFKTRIISKMIFIFLLAFIINSQAQSVSSIQPNPVAPGQILSVLGTNLYTTTIISFAGAVSSTATGMFGGISVSVPVGAMTGLITLTGPGLLLESIPVLTVSSTIDVSDISVFPQGRTISCGSSLQSITNISPINATDKSVTWSVLPSNLGSIASDGTFTANSISGIVTVTATSVSNPSIMGYNVINITNIDVTSVSLSPPYATITGGNNQLFTANILPSNATNPSVIWSVFPSNTGYIQSDGTFTASNTFTGLVTITATSVSNPSVSSIAAVSVVSNVDVTNISISPPSATITGGNNQLFTANILPSNATDKNVTWSISPNTGTIATNGTFTATYTFTGLVTITATSVSNPSISGIAIVFVATPTSIISSNYVNIGVTGYPQTLNITTSSSWTIGSFSGSWFAITPMSGTGNSVITITAAPNYLSQTITGSFHIVAGSQYATVDLSQDASFLGSNLILSENFFIGGPSLIVRTIYVNSNPSNWTITGISNGMSVSPTFGSNGTSFTVTVSPNFTDLVKGNSLSITNGISSAGYTIGQTSLIDPSSLNFNNSGGVKFLEVFTTGLWQVNTINGFTALPLSGVGYGVITITAAPNYSPNTVSGFINISTPNLSSTVGINQEASVTGVSSISITDTTSHFVEGESFNYTVSVLPANATNKNVYWTSYNTIVGIINSSGLFTGLSAGTTTITATSISNPVVTDLIIVTVEVSSTSPGSYFISIVNSSAQTTVVNGNIIVTWPTMAGVSTYCLQYSTDSTFASNVVTLCGLTSPSYTISGLGSSSGRTEGQTIYWKVGAVDDATGAIYWSDVQNTARILQVAAPISVDQLQLYPNPSSDLIHISGLKINDEVLIYDVNASLVLKTNASSINISSLSNGIYVARIGTKSLRFVKQ